MANNPSLETTNEDSEDDSSTRSSLIAAESLFREIYSQVPTQYGRGLSFDDEFIAPEVLTPIGAHSGEERGNDGLTSTGKSFINSVLCFIGSGVLGLPYALGRVGVGAGLLILWGVAAISAHCMFLIVDCKRHLTDHSKLVRTYGDVGFYAFGWVGSFVVDW